MDPSPDATQPVARDHRALPAVDSSGLTARRRYTLLGLVLFVAPLVAGSQWLSATFLQGDEQIFIAQNPDVTGAGRPEPLAQRLLGIFTRVHQDLYQPLPIFTYALEWALAADPAASIRRTDLVLHAINGLLLWWVLVDLLRRLRGDPPAGGRGADLSVATLAWVFALLWALHPINVGVYAADMGRTHLLAATFTLVALWCYPRAGLADAGGRYCFVALAVCLVAAMLSKAIPGLLLVALGIELAGGGLRRALASPRLYVTAAICAFFAWLTLRTSERWGMMADADIRLFGDPVSRSLLATWIYARNTLIPAWLAPWYPPDPGTAYSDPRVWGGALVALATLAIAARAARQPIGRPIALGVLWIWGLLLPVIGLVGARTFAAQDRYLYQPLMGVMLALCAAVANACARLDRPRAAGWMRFAYGGGAAVAVAFALLDMPLAAVSRSMIQRATQTAALFPDDPRAALFLAVSYDYSAQHDAPERRFARAGALIDFGENTRAALRRAAELARGGARYFATPADRASFHLRTSLMMQRVGDVEGALDQALAAQAAEPDTVLGLLRLAQALWSAGRADESRRAYDRLLATIPADAPNRAACLTEYGSLLLNAVREPGEARRVLALALAPLVAVDASDPSAVARGLAQRLDQAGHESDPFLRTFGSDTAYKLGAIGLARAEVRAGLGEAGFALIRALRRVSPEDPDVLLVEGEYHLRSHHWSEARDAYVAILARDPIRYEALIGLHETSAQTGAWPEAADAWRRATVAAGQDSPLQRPFSSFFVWSVACGGHRNAAEFADELLAIDPNNPLACLARAVCEARGGRVEAALGWAGRATLGREIPQARALERAASTLALLRARGELPAEAAIVEARVRALSGQVELAHDVLRAFVAEQPESAWRGQAELLLRATSQPATGPTATRGGPSE